VCGTGIKQDALGRGRLSRVNMGNDADIADAIYGRRHDDLPGLTHEAEATGANLAWSETNRDAKTV